MDDLQKKLAQMYLTHPGIREKAATGRGSLLQRVWDAKNSYMTDLVAELNKLIEGEFKGTSFGGTGAGRVEDSWWAKWQIKIPRLFFDAEVVLWLTIVRDEVHWVVQKGTVQRPGTGKAKRLPEDVARSVFRSFQEAAKPSSR